MSELINVSDAEFEAEVLNSPVPVLVDFWAPWCGPCKMLIPVLEGLSGDLDNVKIVKVNVDENLETSAAYGIRSIPTMILFNNGEIVGKKTGALTRTQVTDFITENVGE